MSTPFVQLFCFYPILSYFGRKDNVLDEISLFQFLVLFYLCDGLEPSTLGVIVFVVLNLTRHLLRHKMAK